MAILTDGFSPVLLQALGSALIDSLWQGLGVAALAAALMAPIRGAALRYGIGVVALAAILVLPATTFCFFLYTPASGAPLVLTGIQSAALATSVWAWAGSGAGQNLWGWLVGAWLCGVVLFSLRLTAGFLWLDQKRRCNSLPADSRILALCHELQDRLGVTRAVRYLECQWLQAPAAMGWIRPIVLLPVAALTGLSEAQLRAVIAHELAHIRRFDVLVNLFQALVEVLLFYHPAVWWLNRRIRAERELCCDDIVISLTGDRLEYASALTQMAEWESLSVLAMSATRSPLTRRILRILGERPALIRQHLTGFAAAALFVAAAVAAINAAGLVYSLSASQPVAIASATVAPAQPLAVEVSQPATASVLQDRAPARIAAQPVMVRIPLVYVSAPAFSPSPEKPATVTPAPANDPPPHAQQASANILPASPAPSAPAASRASTPGCPGPQLLNAVQMTRAPGDAVDSVPVMIGGVAMNFLLGSGSYATMIRQSAADRLKLVVRPSDVHMLHAMTSGQREAVVPDFQMGLMASDNVTAFPIAPETDAASGAFVMNVVRHTAAQSDGILGLPDGKTFRNLISFTLPNSGADTDRSTYQTAANTKAFDGVLGLDFLTRYDSDIDFGTDTYRIFSSDHCPGAGVTWDAPAFAVVPFSRANGVLRIPITLDGQKFTALIDTSAAVSSLRADVAEYAYNVSDKAPAAKPALQEQMDAPPPGVSEAIMVHGVRGVVHTFRTLSFEGVTITNPHMLIVPNSSGYMLADSEPVTGSLIATSRQFLNVPEITIGMDVLRKLHLYIAVQEGKIYISQALTPVTN